MKTTESNNGGSLERRRRTALRDVLFAERKAHRRAEIARRKHTDSMKKKTTKNTQKARSSAAHGSAHWAHCYLEHAARETAWAAQSAKECNYSAAHDALVRRGVWLHAALLAQERNAPNDQVELPAPAKNHE